MSLHVAAPKVQRQTDAKPPQQRPAPTDSPGGTPDHLRQLAGNAQFKLAEPVRKSYTRAIEGYLDYCRLNNLSVGVGTARGFVSDALRRGLTREEQTWKDGLKVSLPLSAISAA